MIDKEWYLLPKTRAEARKAGSVAYFTGKPCRNGHINRRYTNTAICYTCKIERNKANIERYPETAKKIRQKTHKKHEEKRKVSARKWVENNRERVREIKQRSRQKHLEKHRASARTRSQTLRKNDPYFRLCRNISKALWAWMKGLKQFEHWGVVVGYGPSELIARLESQFDEHMSWENYGAYWEVDHIKPLSKCQTLEEAWALENLQPLSRFDNRSKGARYNEEAAVFDLPSVVK